MNMLRLVLLDIMNIFGIWPFTQHFLTSFHIYLLSTCAAVPTLPALAWFGSRGGGRLGDGGLGNTFPS